MTYAQSLQTRIERQSAELQRLLEGIADVAAAWRAGREWSPNEILRHLIGATGDVTAGLRQALTEDDPHIVREQPGGKYLNLAGSSDELLRMLLKQLAEISEAVRALDNVALQRPLTISGEGVDAVSQVPVGLWVRDAVGDHFDAHVEQLKNAIARATRARRVRA